MITYKEKTTIDVLLDKKTVGCIKKNKDNMFQYFPKGCKNGGKPFKTIEEVKRSIEED